nr:dead-box atp-dependent rna helicase 5 [Quercus suber]
MWYGPFSLCLESKIKKKNKNRQRNKDKAEEPEANNPKRKHEEIKAKEKKSKNKKSKHDDKEGKTHQGKEEDETVKDGLVVVSGHNVKLDKYAPLKSFAELGLPQEVLKCYKNFQSLSSIQSHA